jgi:hypothetical protein
VCDEDKPLSEFYTQKKHSKTMGEYLYYNPECKECTKNRSKKWQDDNYEQYQVGFNERSRKKRLIPEKLEYHRIKANEQRKSGYQKGWQIKNKDKVGGYNKYKSCNKTHVISDSEWENCKNYFNYRCAYCDLKIEEHSVLFRGVYILSDFHREHVDHLGSNGLENCVPSCKRCNCRKWKYEFEKWYSEKNEGYDLIRYRKIVSWLSKDYMKYIENK